MQGTTLVRFGRDHAVQVDQQNQATVGRDRRARKKFYATKVFAEALDDDFVLAQNFFDDEANLAVVDVRDNHAEVTVDGFERRQAKVRIEAHNFGDDVADLGEQFSADLFDFVGANAANFFDDSQWQRKIRSSAADEESWRDDERQGNFQGELRALARSAVNLDFAVQGVQVGTNDVEPNSAAGKFGFGRGRRESRMENHFAEIALGEAVGGFG